MQTDTITLRELTIRYSVKVDSTGQTVVVGRALSTPAASAAALAALLQDEPGEVFAILCLSTKHRVIAYHEVSRGTLDATDGWMHQRAVPIIVRGHRLLNLISGITFLSLRRPLPALSDAMRDVDLLDGRLADRYSFWPETVRKNTGLFGFRAFTGEAPATGTRPAGTRRC